MTASMKSIELEVAETGMDNSAVVAAAAEIMVDTELVAASEEMIGAVDVVVLEVVELLVLADQTKRKPQE